MNMLLKLFVLCCFILSTTSYADRWQLPSEIFEKSADDRYWIRVLPGNNFGKLFSFEGMKIDGTNAELYLFENISNEQSKPLVKFTLKNPVSPVFLYVSNQGKTITVDNWSNLGYGSVWVIYQADGTIIKEWKLEDLYSQAEINKIQHSVSSIWWTCEEPKLDNFSNTFSIKGALGREFSFDLTKNLLKIKNSNYICEDQF